MRTLMAEVLAAWRRADRLTHELPEGTPEHAAAMTACERLRDLYHDLAKASGEEALTEADARRLLAELGPAN